MGLSSLAVMANSLLLSLEGGGGGSDGGPASPAEL